MKTLLVLAQHPDLAEAVRAGISSEQYRIVHRSTVEETEPLLVHGLVDACVIDVELTTVQGVWVLEKLRRGAPRLPVIIYTGAKQWEWEEEAYLLGASHVLTKPVRPRMLNAVLEKLWPVMTSAKPAALVAAPLPSAAETTTSAIAFEHAQSNGASFPTFVSPAQNFGPLRDFSGILMHSLDADAMLRQFLMLLRSLLSTNRAAIFLAERVAGSQPATAEETGNRFRASCAIGLSSGMLEHLELSTQTGIGGHLFRLGRILRRCSEEVRHDPETQKEFELLGAQVAIPMLDRDRVIGVALFDGHITGEPLSNSELQLIFNLLEHLSLAIKNIWLHKQVVDNHEIMADVMRELSSACIVVSRDLAVLHANKMARRFFARPERRSSGDLDFTDLPQALGSKVYQVLKTGCAVSNYRFQTESTPPALYNVNIVPFQREHAGLPASALLIAEDLTQAEQLKRLEIETAGLRQLKAMADRLTHEMGNATVRLFTYQQLLSERLAHKSSVEPEFLKTMAADWGEDIKRLRRFINQLRCLNVDSVASEETVSVSTLLEEAFQEASKFQPSQEATYSCDTGSTSKALSVRGDRGALKLAFTEVLLNALQANPADPKIRVRLARAGENGTKVNGGPPVNGHDSSSLIRIEVQDNGTGFSPEAADKVPAPFFTTRNVGLGLGLTVTRKIIETHHGKLEILPPSSEATGRVCISLPVHTEATTATANSCAL